MCSALGRARQAPTLTAGCLEGAFTYIIFTAHHCPWRQRLSSLFHRWETEGLALGKGHLPPHREGLGWRRTVFLLGPQ